MSALPDFTFVDQVADIEKPNGDRLKIMVEDRHGRMRISLRVWFTAADGSLRPGKDGITLHPDALPDVIAGLYAAQLKISGEGAL